MPHVYEIEAVEALKAVARELPELTRAVYQLLDELRALRRALEESELRRT